MTIHTATLALVQTPALGPLDKSASLVSLTLGDCSAELVSRRLGCSAELVRRWGRGQGSPRLDQILGSPERFARRLLARAGELYLPAPAEVPLRERLWLVMAAIGAISAELSGLPRDAELDAVQERARLQRIANEARKASEHALDVARKAEAEIAALDAKGGK